MSIERVIIGIRELEAERTKYKLQLENIRTILEKKGNKTATAVIEIEKILGIK